MKQTRQPVFYREGFLPSGEDIDVSGFKCLRTHVNTFSDTWLLAPNTEDVNFTAKIKKEPVTGGLICPGDPEIIFLSPVYLL